MFASEQVGGHGLLLEARAMLPQLLFTLCYTNQASTSTQGLPDAQGEHMYRPLGWQQYPCNVARMADNEQDRCHVSNANTEHDKDCSITQVAQGFVARQWLMTVAYSTDRHLKRAKQNPEQV